MAENHEETEVKLVQVTESQMEEAAQTKLLTIHATPQQEAAIEVFFQVNNWTLVKEGNLFVHNI